MKFNNFSAVQVRIARPTDKFDEIISFYETGVGLTKIEVFEGDRGIKGVIFGLPHTDYHLEFTSHQDGSPCPAPTKDNLLVFYIENKDEIMHVVNRLAQMGYNEVEPENPYWKDKGVTIEDPDGWRVVFMNRSYD
ncbi:VOC family protein [Oceanobacillus oncorhynchi]|uniref:Glyoxalase/Bleomycin resistance protein/Dioxygenase superfamily protein n=1 Tax=Oceanobacillus oncorhynchi TaxID=545501 RepID=A0A0A1MJH5_9BACI|nr:VOC family protein [Oceanobacillus oncorhynchi]CEI83238.1 Glyoxalase/Bleomycin resistance protein/Dioxygenase superfamily protein [Oceanobacillus oncorhynchi]